MSPTGKKKVLVIEDDRQLRKALVAALTNKGYTVLSSRNGLAGLKLATTKLPDLIVLDLHMPKMDGKELLKRLRENERAKHIPVIILSNDGSKASIKETFKSGAPIYLSKAITSLSELLETINYHLS